MSQTPDVPAVFEVGDHNFATDVIERSRTVPVVVDFWAPWCGPCRMLGPVLDKLARGADGQFVLAKLNTDDNQATAARYGIRGIPDVKLFIDGEVAAQFTGALPESAVRRFLRQNIPSEADDHAAEAAAMLKVGEPDRARAAAEAAIAIEPRHARAHLVLAQLAVADGDEAALERHAAAIPTGTPEADEVGHLRSALGFAATCREAGGLDACRARLAAAPDDLDARHALGCCLAASSAYREALEAFLDVVKADKNHAGGAAHKAMLMVFGLLGAGNALAREFRGELMVYL